MITMGKIKKKCYSVILYNDIVHNYEGYMFGVTACAELYHSFKPQNSNRVANRMIGAALGIRIPSSLEAKSTARTETKPVPKIDAWDD